MTKLSDLKVGDKFRFCDDDGVDDLVVREVIASRTYDGDNEVCIWSQEYGFAARPWSDEVIPIREPQYRPYSDLRVLLLKALAIKGQEDHVVVIHATKSNMIISTSDGELVGYNSDDALRYTEYLDGTPCGELCE